MRTKVCYKCFKDKPLYEFYISKRNKDGYYSYCRACDSITNKEWRKSNKELCRIYSKKDSDKKRKLCIDCKKGLKCIECGENHPSCLVFHYRNPDEKDFDIGGSFYEKSVERVMSEIAKCDVLCANCHRKLHYNLKEN